MSRIMLVLFFLVTVVNVGLCEDQIKIKGYFQEDGSYVKQRMIDPIKVEDNFVYPELSKDLMKRKLEIAKFYVGRVMTSKISFPACRSGVVVRLDDIKGANVGIFKKIKRYGASIEKGNNVMITCFKINGNVMDIELNKGGYGDAWDITSRVLVGVVTCGVTELVVDYSTARYKKGSRLRLCSEKPWKLDDLEFEKIERYLSLFVDRGTV